MPQTRSTPNRNMSGCAPLPLSAAPLDQNTPDQSSPEQTRSVVMQLNFPPHLSDQAIQKLSSCTPHLFQSTIDNVISSSKDNRSYPATNQTGAAKGVRFNEALQLGHCTKQLPINSNKTDTVSQIRAQILASDILHAYNVHESTIDVFTKLFDGDLITKKDVKNMVSEVRYARDNRGYREEPDYDSPTPDKKRNMKRGRNSGRTSRFNIDH